jgi:hypothetical protein
LAKPQNGFLSSVTDPYREHSGYFRVADTRELRPKRRSGYIERRIFLNSSV